MAKIQGKDGPDLDAGTPVQEILAEEKDVRATAPEVLKEQMKKDPEGGKENARPNLNPQGIRSFSTMARRRLEVHSAASQTSAMDAAMLYPTSTSTAQTPITTPTQQPGHKFPLPELPLPPTAHKEYRHDPIVTQLTNLLMRDGKKSVAERNMAVILSTLRTTPAPTYSPQRTLLPGAPPASHLPLNPVLYLTLAVDSVAPLLRIRSQRGAAGGGVALQIPVPLALRQRRRQAFSWILDAASKRQNRGSGNHTFALRVAQEIVSVVEGRSGVWERRNAVHKLGTTARSNLSYGRGGRR